MRRGLGWLTLAALSACVGFNIEGPSNCATLCQRARDCGFLPSMLGWDAGGDATAAQVDCERRCGDSPATDAVVQAVVGCLETEADPGMTWCTDTASDHYEVWESCAAIGQCFRRKLGDSEQIGDVDLTVQLLRFSDYELHFGPIADMYAARVAEGMTGARSCEPALCGQDTCKELVCEQASCTDTDGLECADEICSVPGGEICSTTLCRVGGLTVSSVCRDLGVQRVTLVIRENASLPLTQVIVDDSAGLNSDCGAATWTQTEGNFRIKPGPMEVDAEVVAALPGDVLEPLGLLPDGAPADDTVTEFCVKFFGPAMITRAGLNTMVVPLGDVEGLQALADAGLVQRCNP